MPAPVQDPAWDLSPVFDLIHSLSHKDVAASDQWNEAPTPLKQAAISAEQRSVKDSISESLGNFSKVWDFLGVQRDVPPPSVPPFEAVTAGQISDKDAYASDGALYYPPSSKSVKWRDEEEGKDLTDFQPESPLEDNGLTKAQRKKRNKRARQAAGWNARADQLEKRQLERQAKASGNESESSPPAPAPARLASIHTVKPHAATKEAQPPSSSTNSKTPTKTVNQASKHSATSAVPKAQPSQPSQVKGLPTSVVPKIQSSQPKVWPSKPDESTGPYKTTPTTPKTNGALRPAQITPSGSDAPTATFPMFQNPSSKSLAPPATPKTPVRPPLNSVHESLKTQFPMADPFGGKGLSASAQAPRVQPLSAKPVQSTAVTQTPTRKRYEILPMNFNNSIDRNWSLLLKLINHFPADRAHLLSPLQLTINRPISNGIHVFVDASNIIIGFHDTLKRVRNIPQHVHVPRVNLNFHALALLLERRRPVTKRVLAGSTPEIPAFEEARQVGYETNILDKVFKAKELTERQRRFQTRDGTRKNGYHSGSDSTGNGLLATNGFLSDGTVTDTAGLTAPAKWVEQAVDEILHLKILESICDTPIPAQTPVPAGSPPQHGMTTTLPSAAPTMVLATGDAAEAEYSSGFMKMVQRALGKGWNVEVMAWSKSVSMEYRRMEKSAALGARFKIIELDDYAEELFGEAV